jgi:hypothetical protein
MYTCSPLSAARLMWPHRWVRKASMICAHMYTLYVQVPHEPSCLPEGLSGLPQELQLHPLLC